MDTDSSSGTTVSACGRKFWKNGCGSNTASRLRRSVCFMCLLRFTRAFGISLSVLACVWCGSECAAQESDANQALRERFFALPVELDVDFGADNGDAFILKFAPLYSVGLGNNWSLVNLNLITLADTPGGIAGTPGNPSPLPGDRVFGLGDLTHASFLTPKRSGRLIYGFGGILTVPLATDSVLGSDKWSAGPALRITYREGPWNIGLFGGNYWSFAGSDSRADINQFLLRGAIRRDLNKDWYFVSAPVITANWKASSGNKWVVPLGGGFGRQLGSDTRPWAVSLQAYVNVIKPDGAPDWALRLSVIAAVPIRD